MGRFLLILGRVAIWAFIIGIGWITYDRINKKHPSKPKEEFVPFPCPYCGEKITYSDDNKDGTCTCFECGRLVMYSRGATEEELVQIGKEREDCSEIAESLEISNIFQRLMDRVANYPDLFHVTEYISRREGSDFPIVKIFATTRIVDPGDLSDKLDKKELPPEPVEFYIKTKAGEILFYRSLVRYIQDNYSDVYHASIGSSRECVMFTVNSK